MFKVKREMRSGVTLSKSDSELLVNFCLERPCLECPFCERVFEANQFSFKCQFELPPYIWHDFSKN